jgi:hypothetical protein
LDEPTARSSLLQFYGQRTVSFASLFVASIFGLITWLGIVQRIEGEGTSYLIFMFLSSIVYVALAYVSWHTFRRYVYYADLTSKLAENSRGSMRDYAKFEEMDFGIEKEHYEALPEELKRQTKKEGDKFYLNFKAYFDVENKNQSQSLLKKVNFTGRKFRLVYLISIILLWIVVYIPLLISHFFT